MKLYEQVPAYPRLSYAVNMAARFLEENNVRSFPIDIAGIIQGYGWHLQPFSELARSEWCPYTIDEFCDIVQTRNGFTVPHQDCGYIIAYNDSPMVQERVTFTLCHEVGHCFLRHFSDFDIQQLLDSEKKILDEEANVFALNILIPVCIYDNLQNTDRLENRYIFGVSKSAYQYRTSTAHIDRKLLNNESTDALKGLFQDYMLGCRCRACGKCFVDTAKTRRCTRCGSSDIEWLYTDELHAREKESRKQVRWAMAKMKDKAYFDKYHPVPPREERIQKMLYEQYDAERRIQDRCYFFCSAQVDEIENPMVIDSCWECDAYGRDARPKAQSRNAKKTHHRGSDRCRAGVQPKQDRQYHPRGSAS